MRPEIENEAQLDRDDVIGTSIENSTDEAMIVMDQDQTASDRLASSSPFYSQPKNARYIENEPDEFIAGGIDVVEQMKRTTRRMQTAIDHHEGTLPMDMQSEETEAAFESTPGGLEEVFNKTDQDLIEKKQYHI